MSSATEASDPLDFAISRLTERLAEDHADVPVGAVVRVVEGARAGIDSRMSTIQQTVDHVERTARDDLDRLRRQKRESA
jgi:hypothetical protein